MSEPEALIFEKSRTGRRGASLPDCDVPREDPSALLGGENLRGDLPLPEVSELDVVRHFTRLSQRNYAIETGFYPLGSCTMKYNPKINEKTAGLPGFASLHPMQPSETIPGALDVLVGVQEMLQEITGFDDITLQPLAGAHGEMTCLMLIKAYFESRGEGK